MWDVRSHVAMYNGNRLKTRSHLEYASKFSRSIAYFQVRRLWISETGCETRSETGSDWLVRLSCSKVIYRPSRTNLGAGGHNIYRAAPPSDNGSSKAYVWMWCHRLGALPTWPMTFDLCCVNKPLLSWQTASVTVIHLDRDHVPQQPITRLRRPHHCWQLLVRHFYMHFFIILFICI